MGSNHAISTIRELCEPNNTNELHYNNNNNNNIYEPIYHEPSSVIGQKHRPRTLALSANATPTRQQQYMCETDL
jgi:hypothetical protein